MSSTVSHQNEGPSDGNLDDPSSNEGAGSQETAHLKRRESERVASENPGSELAKSPDGSHTEHPSSRVSDQGQDPRGGDEAANGEELSSASPVSMEQASTPTKSTPETQDPHLPGSPAAGENGRERTGTRSELRPLPRQTSGSSHVSEQVNRPRSESQSTAITYSAPRSSSISSMVFVVSALEAIASSKEARKRKQLGDASQRALKAIKETDPQLPDPELIFEPLKLATLSGNIPLATTALDSIGKLISYSYFSNPHGGPGPHSGEQAGGLPLIERAIDTIIDCFQGEATPAEVQLQIVKSLLAAVLNDQIVVHGAGLLKAVRQTYNIFLLSKSSGNQQIAQGTLTQMIGTVFERLKARLGAKHNRLEFAKLSLRKSFESQSQMTLDTHSVIDEKYDGKGEPGASDTPLTTRSDSPSGKAAEERITLQSFENRKSFDDERINDSAPTMVTPAPSNQAATRSVSGRDLSATRPADERRISGGTPRENEEDEIYIKDAFLVFRAMCKLSIKTLPPDQLLDYKSHGMRSKLLSLHLVHTILNNHMTVFTSPLATIRSSSSDDPSSFLHATKQYLCLCLSRNGASSVSRVFEVGCEIFWLMLKNMRVMLKKEIEVFLKEIYLAILDRRGSPASQKQSLMVVFERLCADPRALVEIYLNYDCDRSALDNMFQRIIEQLSRISSTSVAVTPLQQEQYREHHQKVTSSASDWREPGTFPPSLSTADITSVLDPDPASLIEYSLRHQSLECLVSTLRSLVDWSQQGIADVSAQFQELGLRASIDESGESAGLQGLAPSASTSTPEIQGALVMSPGPLDDDPGELEIAKQRKTALLKGIKQFNFKPKKGIKYLLNEGFVPNDAPEEIASFLLQNPGLDKAMIGEYLGEGDPQNVAIMHAFIDFMDFTKTRFVDALRRFLQSFRLPGEAQKIDRFMLKFAERYMTGNPNAFANADTAYVLAYSVIMLNTDQHSTKLKGRRMTKEDFIKNNRGINDNADLPDEYLGGIYDEIAHNEIVLNTERDAADALGVSPQVNPGFAANIGQALATVGRDLQREAYMQASQEMATKTEQLFRSLLRAQRKNASKPSQTRFIPATSFKHVGPMFEVTWMPFLSGLAGQIQDTQDEATSRLCMEGFKLAIRIACLFDLETPRLAFVSTLARLTNLNKLNEMTNKNMEALKVLLEVAQTEGNLLKSSWKEVLTCISQLDRFQLISSGIDEGAVPDVSKARVSQPGAMDPPPSRRGTPAPRRPRPRGAASSTNYLPTVVQESRSADVIKAVDRIFTSTANLSGEAIVHFVRALSEVSWQEIQSSGQSDSPRTFSLQKLVEISYYNMTRVRFEWSAVWQVLGEHFNQVGCHSNTNVVFMALDSLRQLSMRFMEIEELPGFKFQKDFLKPFEHVMANSGVVPVKDMVLRCLIQMIQARGDNIRSGWKTMFGVFTVAARESYEAIVNLAFDHVVQIYNTRFGMVVSQGAFADLVVCLTEFSKNMKFQKKSLQAIETLKSTIPRMLKTPECPLSTSVSKTEPAGSAIQRSPTRIMQEEQFWFPVLFAFHNVLMTGEDLEVRSRALGYLFESLIKHGGDFSSEFWDILWRQLLYPIFMVLKSKSELTRALNHEELSVWLSTTMIQALRNMITLFTHYFSSLEYMLDRFLDLLTLCICQENDTIARIGSNCLQQLILQNVNKFEAQHWTKIVGAFVELFERTTASQLFSAATSANAMPGTANVATPHDANSGPDVPLGFTPVDESPPGGMEQINSLRINGLPPSNPAQLVEDTRASAPVLPNGSSNGPQATSATATDLEDYRKPSELQQQPVVVTAARRRFFSKIITKCILQLLMIETVNELFSNDAVYAQIPSPELLRLMGLLKKSFLFARKFNAEKDLRMRLWREGFMKQPPNLLKQESGSAATYISILLRMYHDEGEERKRNRADIEAALIPLCSDIVHSYTTLDEDTQQRNILAWRPVVVDVLEGYTNFPRDGFDKHIELFYPLAVDLLARDSGLEMRVALQALLRRIGEIRLGIVPPPPPSVTSPMTSAPTSPISPLAGGGAGSGAGSLEGGRRRRF